MIEPNIRINVDEGLNNGWRGDVENISISLGLGSTVSLTWILLLVVIGLSVVPKW